MSYVAETNCWRETGSEAMLLSFFWASYMSSNTQGTEASSPQIWQLDTKAAIYKHGWWQRAAWQESGPRRLTNRRQRARGLKKINRTIEFWMGLSLLDHHKVTTQCCFHYTIFYTGCFFENYIYLLIFPSCNTDSVSVQLLFRLSHY